MKPKEKAVELVDKFHSDVDDCDKHYAAEADGRMCSHMAKQCALICVDEVLKCVFKSTDVQEYWNEVKTEIQNL